jgi:hypothetical protein
MFYLFQFTTILIVQIVMIYLYTKPMARFQTPIVKGMIDYWPPVGNPYTEPFHRYGWQLAFCFGFFLLLFHASIILCCFLSNVCSMHAFYTIPFTPVLCMLWHWKVFDEEMGSALHNNRFFIGSSSKLDKKLIKKYGADAGEKKDRLSLEAIAILNVIYLVINFFIR